MELIEWILQESNIADAIAHVKRNHGAPGVDDMPVGKLDEYFEEHGAEIRAQIRGAMHKPNPVRMSYISGFI